MIIVSNANDSAVTVRPPEAMLLEIKLIVDQVCYTTKWPLFSRRHVIEAWGYSASLPKKTTNFLTNSIINKILVVLCIHIHIVKFFEDLITYTYIYVIRSPKKKLKITHNFGSFAQEFFLTIRCTVQQYYFISICL